MIRPRVRFAPSPTGYLHIGGLRTALFNHLFAKATGGTFILRIEDTDQTRLVPNSANNLIKMLKWSGIDIDEGPETKDPTLQTKYGPYVQSERLPLYKKHVDELVKKGAAYPCFCSTSRLKMLRKSQQKSSSGPMIYDRRCYKLSPEEIETKLNNNESHTIRMLIPNNNQDANENKGHEHEHEHENKDAAVTKIHDLVLGTSIFPHHVIDDQILLKSDGFPTYHLANVVDDHYMKITHVIRGEEWLPSTPKHQLLYQAFGWDLPQFAHLPLLLNNDRSKLSKRQGDVAVEDYVQKGYLPSGLCNFVALLGWNPGDGETNELYNPNELIQAFTLERVNKGGAVVDRDKLFWMNGEHIRLLVNENPNELFKQALPFMTLHLHQKHDINEQEALELIVGKDGVDGIVIGIEGGFEIQPPRIHAVAALTLLSQRARTLEEFGSLCEYFFVEPKYDNIEVRKKMWSNRNNDLLEAAKKVIVQEKDVFENSKTLKKRMKQLLKETEGKYKMKDLFLPLRYAVSGTNVGADLMETMVLLGRDKCMRRLVKVLDPEWNRKCLEEER